MDTKAILSATRPRPRTVVRALLLIACALASHLHTSAQTPAPVPKDTSTLAGRVTSEGQGVAGVLVTLIPAEWNGRPPTPAAKATTDADGQYRLTNAPPGHYYLTTSAPAYVLTNGNAAILWRGRQLNILAGDQLAGLDFTLTRGGVITGRVLNADGKPLIEALVRLRPVDETDRRNPQVFSTPVAPYTFQTDDRGSYRLYGLNTGRYLVYVGDAQDTGNGRVRNGSYYPRTFYGDTTEETKAKPVEVTAGAETSGVDITLGNRARSYEAAGRVVDDRGQPVAGAMLGYSPIYTSGRFAGRTGASITGEQTNARGEFHIKGLLPGRYSLFAAPPQAFPPAQSPFYSAPVSFEITEQDVSGLKLNLVRGATISGVVVLEGITNPTVRANSLKELQLGAIAHSPDSMAAPFNTPAPVNADGSFLLTGLPPGLIEFYPMQGFSQPQGLTIVRVQHDGAEQPQGLEVAAGAQVTGVRVVMAYGVSVIRGQVQFPTGAWPAGGRIAVNVQRLDAATTNGGYVASVVVDELGRFVVENLSAGQYELTLFDASPGRTPGQGRQPADRKPVSVPDSGEVQVTLIFNQPAPPPQ